MGNVVIWALLTGLVTGGAWLGIVVVQRQRRLAEHRRAALADDLHERMEELESVSKRLAEVEERLEFTERLLSQERDARRLSPPG